MRTPAPLVVWLTLVLAASPAAGQEPPQPPAGNEPVQRRPVPRDGTDALRDLLDYNGIRPVTTFEEINAEPGESILIVLGDLSAVTDRLNGIGRFLERGGAILVATDYRMPFGDFRFDGSRVWSPEPGDCYREIPNCPFVRVTKPDWERRPLPANAPERLFAKLEHIATNNPTYLGSLGDGLPPMAWLPDSARIGDRSLPTRDRVFAAGGNGIHGGRLLYLADHSVFINEMMLPPDNDNYEFAINCVGWLAEGPAGAPRTKCLFIEDGVVAKRFDVPLPKFPPPPLDLLANLMLQHGNRLLGAIERDKLHNKLLEQNISRDRLLRALALGLTAALVFYGFRRMWAARHRFDLQVPRFAVSVARLAPEGPILEQRHEALIDQGNLYEAARAVTRRRLAELGAGETPGDEPPTIISESGALELRRLRREVEGLWRLAYGRRARRVTLQEWERLSERLDELVSEHEQKRWRFATGGEHR